MKQYHVYYILNILNASMILLNVFNIQLSTVLYEKEDYDFFMSVFDRTIMKIIQPEFNAAINEDSVDKTEMETLWREIVAISKNIISFSLDLIYESLDDVMSKLKAAIQNMITNGKEDLQIGFFLKYISIPETMNKLLLKDETRNDVLNVYQQLIQYENNLQTGHLRETDYDQGTFPLLNESNPAFRLFIDEVN